MQHRTLHRHAPVAVIGALRKLRSLDLPCVDLVAQRIAVYAKSGTSKREHP